MGARGKNEAILSNRSVAPKLLDGTLDAINRDGNVGIGAGLVVGELDSGFGLPSSLGGRRGESGDREEGTGKCGDVDELHLGWKIEIFWEGNWRNGKKDFEVSKFLWLYKY